MARIPLVGNFTQRIGTSPTSSIIGGVSPDQAFYNVIPETVQAADESGQNHIYLNKRCGYTAYTTYTGGTIPTAGQKVQGIFKWNTHVYSVVGGNLYVDSTFLGSIGSVPYGRVGFASSPGPSGVLFIATGSAGYYINMAGTLTQITDVNYPTNNVPAPIWMDGYFFVINSANGTVQNSNLGDVTTWSPTNFFTPTSFSGAPICLGKQTSQLVVFCQRSTEFWYDAGNATGSPLSRTDQIVNRWGMANFLSYQESEGEHFWVSTTDSGMPCIAYMRGFQVVELAYPDLNRRMLGWLPATYAGFSSGIFRLQGQLMYLLNTPYNTWVYSQQSQMWTIWTSGNSPERSNFDGVFFAYDFDNGRYYLQSNLVNGTIFSIDSTSYQDNGVSFIARVQTIKVDGGNNLRKVQTRLDLIGDYNTSGSQPINVWWSDDDYNTWKGPRILNGNNVINRLFRGGQFRRRAFRLEEISQYPFRWEAIDLEIDQGGT